MDLVRVILLGRGPENAQRALFRVGIVIGLGKIFTSKPPNLAVNFETQRPGRFPKLDFRLLFHPLTQHHENSPNSVFLVGNKVHVANFEGDSNV